MKTIEQTLVVDGQQLAELRSCRTDLVAEVAAGIDTWTMVEGPFRHYKRTLRVDSATNGDPLSNPSYTVSEQTTFELAIPYWWPFVQPLMTRALLDTNRTPRKRWWWSTEIITQTTAQLFGSLAVFGLISGYLGVTIGQTLTFAAEEFKVDEAAQSQTLAAVRIGVVLSLIALWRGHRVGRRPMILAFTVIAIVCSLLGAASPNLVALGLSQTVGRGLTTGLISLIALSTTEEVPASSRAVSVSYMAMATAVGSSLVLLMLPLADVAIWGWRLIYVVPLAFLPLVYRAAKHLPETQRYSAATEAEAPAKIDMKRLTLIAGSAFAIALFVSPASQLRNDFLNDDLGYSALQVGIFQAVIFAPAGIAMVLSGLVADRKGRRVIGAVTLAFGAALTAISFQTTGVLLWVTASLGAVSLSAFFPAFRVYGTELFPTRARARAAGWIDLVGVSGSAVGLLAVGWLSNRLDGLPASIGVMVVPALLASVVFWRLYPETAKRDLEVFNPADPTLRPTIYQSPQASRHEDSPGGHDSRQPSTR